MRFLEDEAPTRTAPPRRKNTRRWCRGRVGVEHDYEERDYYEFKFSGYPWFRDALGSFLVDVCRTCGKQARLRDGPTSRRSQSVVG
jgi:hypothetical protein